MMTRWSASCENHHQMKSEDTSDKYVPLKFLSHEQEPEGGALW